MKALHDQGVAVYMAEVHAPVLGFGRKTGLIDLIGADHIFPSVDAAVQAVAPTGQEMVSGKLLPATS